MSIAAGNPPYRASEPSAPASWPGFAFACCTIGASLLGWAVAGFQIIFLVPRFVKTFNDFRMALPMATQLLIDHGWWIVPATMVVTFLLCALFRTRWMWIVLLIVIPVFVNLSIMVNLYYPQMMLLEGLAK